MAPKTRFLQILGYKILSLNFVQNDDSAFHSDSNAV
jgi:hypothetical protein